MSNKQKIVLLIGTAVIAVMGIYPPWVFPQPFSYREYVPYGMDF